MIKRRSTKHQMIFEPVTIFEQLKIKYENYKSLNKIYMPRKHFLEYKKYILENHPGVYYINKGKVFFKGAEVLPL